MAKVKPKAPDGEIHPHLMTVSLDMVRMGDLYLCKPCADKDKFLYTTFTKKGARVVCDDIIKCKKCKGAMTA